MNQQLIRTSKSIGLALGRGLLVLSLQVLLLAKPALADLKFGVTPYLSEAQMQSIFGPILQELSKAVEQDVSLVIARDYSDLAAKIKVGAVDLAAFSPFAYVDAVETAQVRIFASHLVEGSPTYNGYIIARSSDRYRSLDQLQNKTFAFVDPKSASGFLYPRAMLIQQGKNPDLFFRKSVFMGSHDRVIRAVLNGETDAGATYDGAFEAARRNGLPVDTLTVLGETEAIPHDAYVAGPTLDPKLLVTIRRFFLALNQKQEPLKSIRVNHPDVEFTGWIAADDARYDVVRDTAALSKHKKTITTWKFTTSDRELGQQKLEDVVGEMLSNYLAESKRFHIVPYAMLEQTVFQHKLAFPAHPTAESMTPVFDQLNVDIVLSGSLEKRNGKLELVVTGHAIGEKGRPFIKAVQGDGIETLDRMIVELTAQIQAELPLEAYIVNVDGKQITIDGGTENGFREEMKFLIVNLAEKVWNDDQSRVTGRKRRVVGEGRFSSLKKGVTVGDITAGDLGQIDVGSRIQVVEIDRSSFAVQNKVYTSYLKGIQALGEGNNREAIKNLQTAIEHDPHYAMAHIKLSNAYFNLGRRETGLTYLKSAADLAKHLTFQESNYILARAATENKQFDEAIRYYHHILEKYQTNTAALHNLGLLYMNRDYKGKNYQTAVGYFQKVLAIDPTLKISRGSLKKASRLASGVATSDIGNSVDIVVIVDISRSMRDEIEGLLRMTGKFADTLAEEGIDFHFGLVSFDERIRQVYGKKMDWDRNWSYKVKSVLSPPELTSSVSMFKSWLGGLEINGSGDENPFGAISKALHYRFHPEAKTIFIVMTDEPPHLQTHKIDPACVINELNRYDIKAFTVTVNTDDYKDLAAKTGGKFYDISGNSDFTEIIQQIGHDISGLF